MKILYTNSEEFHKYADKDNSRRPLITGGVFRDANAWDARCEPCEEVLIDPEANAAEEIANFYRDFRWVVPGSYPGTTKTLRAKVTMLNEAMVSRAKKQVQKNRDVQFDAEEAAG